MEKTYLDYDLFIEAYEKNEKFRNMVYEDATEEAYFNQSYDECYLDLKGVSFNPHYNTFYCRITDLKDFIYSLEDIQKKLYVLDEESEKLFYKVYEAFERFNCMNYDNKQYENLEEWLYNKSELILEKVENYLHDYESNEYIESMIHDEYMSNHYKDYYILNNDVSKVYYDVSYTKEF